MVYATSSWQRYSEAGAAARAEAVVAPQGRARPGCARSRQGTEFAGSRFRSSTVKFVPRHGRPNARRDLDHAAAARPRRSGHLIAAAIKRYSVSSIPGARPRRGRACATPWPSGGRALRLGGPPGCDELTYPRRCDRQPARSRRPAQPSLRVRAGLRPSCSRFPAGGDEQGRPRIRRETRNLGMQVCAPRERQHFHVPVLM